MAQTKISISLEPELVEFLDQQGGNRSQIISDLLWEKKRELFLKELGEAYAQQSASPEFQAEAQDWEITVGDGIDAERETELQAG